MTVFDAAWTSVAHLARQCGGARRLRSFSPLNNEQILDQHLADAPRPTCAATDQGHMRGLWGDWIHLPITDRRRGREARGGGLSRRRAFISFLVL